ncbi:hypothetical protein [Parvibaculum sp.]|uniref:hypothetical protein n=1 Tax=Parvibaculum sp. TaxID=2024848 RepID=UPI001DA15547|nr:hypothetical protein [Parvibaculum sp.]MBX3490862.1 hypothetical protein [Parvibaculum sp.]
MTSFVSFVVLAVGFLFAISTGALKAEGRKTEARVGFFFSALLLIMAWVIA